MDRRAVLCSEATHCASNFTWAPFKCADTQMMRKRLCRETGLNPTIQQRNTVLVRGPQRNSANRMSLYLSIYHTYLPYLSIISINHTYPSMYLSYVSIHHIHVSIISSYHTHHIYRIYLPIYPPTIRIVSVYLPYLSYLATISIISTDNICLSYLPNHMYGSY